MDYAEKTIKMLLAKAYTEAPSNNKSWRTFFQADSPDTRWFVHDTGKVRRGKSVHSSAAITPEARRMLGHWQVEQNGGNIPEKQKPEKQTKKANLPKNNAFNKTLAIFEALSRDEGVTLDELTDLTKWQKHTVRGYLSNLRKKLKNKGEDSQIVKYTRDNKTMYKLEALEKTHQD